MAQGQGYKRYEHYLSAAKPAPWPDAVLCVGATVAWTPYPFDARRERLSLSSWHAVLLVRHGAGFAADRSVVGTTADAFWGSVKTLSLRSKRPWIISACFRQDAVALELWDRMEGGNVRLVGQDHRRGIDHPSAVRDMRQVGKEGSGQSPASVRESDMPELSDILHPPECPPPQKVRRRKGRDAGVCILEDPPIVLKIKVDGGGAEITWVDVANYGVEIGDETSQETGKAHKVAQWFLGASSILRKLGRCGWQATAGSQAMHLFRCSYLDSPILSHTHPDATRLESKAIFGGRCEPFALGRIASQLHLYDIRSMYPYIMATTPMPTRLAEYRASLSVANLTELCEQYCCIADVAIETEMADYPYRHGNAVIYPCGRFWTCLSGQELRHALSAGVVRGVRQAACYKTGFALKRYATSLYAARTESDNDHNAAESAYVKRLMVALPGKFGQRVAAWQDVPGAECPWEWAEWYSLSASGEPQRWRSIAGRIQREIREGFSHGAVPAISAVICAAGRMRLLAAMNAAGRESVLYCDTDAIMVDDYGAESLTLADWVRPGEWGWMQHVISAEGGEIHGVKRYRIGSRVREAGRAIDAAGGCESPPAVSTQPGIGWSLRKQMTPADWRESHPWQRGPGRYEASREAGGLVRTIEIMEW